MTMKRRIFISNTIMVLISLLILFGIGGFSVLLFKDEFMNVIEQNAELSDDIYEVQQILLEEEKNHYSWDELSDKLDAYDYNLYVSNMKQKKVYSNTKHSAMECIEELEDNNSNLGKMKIYSMENITIAKYSIDIDGARYFLYATSHEEKGSVFGMDRGMFEMFIIVFVVAGIIIIAGLLYCSQFFTKLMIKRIMKPVDELNNAAKRINEGDFDKPINYAVNDEFMEVCDTFNSMQKHLKEGIEKNIAYEKARTEMISGISHDLRTPLTSVKGFVKGMLDGVANTPEKKKQYLEISYRKACDMEVLLQKLFFFSKLETGNMPFFMKPTDINKWLHNYIENKKIEENGKCEFTFDYDEIVYLVNMDKEQLKRVFDNLIENSKKYACSEALKIEISFSRYEDNVIIRFKDNGKGVPNEKINHIFEQFYRGDEARNSKNDGSGLGLYVCKYILEQHKGMISAKNDNGFIIEIQLPIMIMEG